MNIVQLIPIICSFPTWNINTNLKQSSMKKITILGAFLLYGMLTFAQINPEVKEFQTTYSDNFSRNTESVFLHLNKTAFLPNEELWFSAYVVDLQTNTPLSEASNLQVDVYDSSGNFIEKETVFVWNGKASGYINLTKDTYTHGKYYLKARTPYMKEQIEDLSYVGSFSIVNDPYLAKDISPEYNVQLMAEGGDLLANVENSLGVKLETNIHADKNYKGLLLNRNNDTLNRFSSNQYGLAQVSFIPELNEDYRVELKLSNGKKLTQKVPEILENGISLSANVREDEVFISVKTNEQSYSRIKGKVFNLAISKNADIKNYSFRIPEASKEALFRFKNDSIFKGVNRITVFDDEFKPISERLIFNYYELPESEIEITTTRKAGDSIQISLAGVDEELYNLSISALPANTKSYKPGNNIISAILLQPYVKGEIEGAQYYFNEEVKQRKRSYDLNMLLLTQGWSKFEWNEILNSSQKDIERIRGFKLLGSIKGKSKHDGQIFIRDDKTGLMNLAELKSNGSFEFENLFLEDSTELSVGILNSRKGKVEKPVVNYRIVPGKSRTTPSLNDLLAGANYDRYYSTPFEDFVNTSEMLETVNITGVKKSEKDEAEEEMIMLNTTSALSKFIKIDEDKERMFHYVTQLIEQNGFRVLRTMGDLKIYSKTPVAFQRAVLTPQLYVDGMRIMDFDMLQTMRTDEIEYIYFNRSALAGYGQGAGNGVIKIKMKDGQSAFNRRETIRKILITDAYQQQKKYYAPKYRSYTSNLFQDFGTIGWIPELIISPETETGFSIRNTMQKNISLYIEGFTQSGKLVSQKLVVSE